MKKFVMIGLFFLTVTISCSEKTQESCWYNCLRLFCCCLMKPSSDDDNRNRGRFQGSLHDTFVGKTRVSDGSSGTRDIDHIYA